MGIFFGERKGWAMLTQFVFQEPEEAIRFHKRCRISWVDLLVWLLASQEGIISMELVDLVVEHSRGGQLDQFWKQHFRRQQSARAMKVSWYEYGIWKICDNN
jgi:hypothetical protein